MYGKPSFHTAWSCHVFALLFSGYHMENGDFNFNPQMDNALSRQRKRGRRTHRLRHPFLFSIILLHCPLEPPRFPPRRACKASSNSFQVCNFISILSNLFLDSHGNLTTWITYVCVFVMVLLAKSAVELKLETRRKPRSLHPSWTKYCPNRSRRRSHTSANETKKFPSSNEPNQV